jgi:N-acetylneuraminic acid mutarotase
MRLRFIGQSYSKSVMVTGYIILTFLCLSSICFAEEGFWTRKADMPTPRHGFGNCVVNGLIYTIGGRQYGSVVPAVEVYDTATDTWTRKANMPTPRGVSAGGVVDGKIYIIGGTQGEPWSGISAVEESRSRDGHVDGEDRHA